MSNRAYELFEQYSEGKFDRITLNKLMFEATEEAKEMEKEKIKDAWKNGRPYWGNVEDRDAEEYYNETYRGNK